MLCMFIIWKLKSSLTVVIVILNARSFNKDFTGVEPQLFSALKVLVNLKSQTSKSSKIT